MNSNGTANNGDGAGPAETTSNTTTTPSNGSGNFGWLGLLGLLGLVGFVKQGRKVVTPEEAEIVVERVERA
jgi:MYXO-CTERM domain-containing protein